jgi:hypothetical protein
MNAILRNFRIFFRSKAKSFEKKKRGKGKGRNFASFFGQGHYTHYLKLISRDKNCSKIE